MTTDEFKLALGKLIRELDSEQEAILVMAEVALLMLMYKGYFK